jgi:hypothetical protein
MVNIAYSTSNLREWTIFIGNFYLCGITVLPMRYKGQNKWALHEFLQFHYNYITIGLTVEINFRLRLSTYGVVFLESDDVLMYYPSTDHIHHVSSVIEGERGNVHMIPAVRCVPQDVTHPSTDCVRCCLISVIEQDRRSLGNVIPLGSGSELYFICELSSFSIEKNTIWSVASLYRSS